MSGSWFARRAGVGAALAAVFAAGALGAWSGDRAGHGGPDPLRTPTVLPGTAPAGSAFYIPPKPLPAGAPGTVVRHAPLDVAPQAMTVLGVRMTLVMYLTPGADGSPSVASGSVTVPPGTPPPGGWPVIAWDHGTSGIATDCAASTGPWNDVLGSNAMLQTLLRKGYAVVQPDYLGMGVTGIRHPYLVGRPAATATIDLVRAARALDPAVGRDFFAIGHSQGGHAALWTADVAPSYAPDLRLRGVVPVAPGSGFELMPALVAKRDASSAPYVGIFLMIVDGASAADPAIKPETLLTPAALKAADEFWHTCAPGAFLDIPPPDRILLPGADLGPITRFLEANASNRVRLTVPVFLPQGTADPLAILNAGLMNELCAKGASVLFKTYPGLMHGPEEVAGAADDIVAWIQDRMAGKPSTGACQLS